MNKAELVNKVADKTGFSRKDTEKIICTTLDVIMRTLRKDEKVALVGFGAFTPKHRAAREGHNPTTNETIDIKPSRACAFKAGKNMKEILNSK